MIMYALHELRPPTSSSTVHRDHEHQERRECHSATSNVLNTSPSGVRPGARRTRAPRHEQGDRVEDPIAISEGHVDLVPQANITADECSAAFPMIGIGIRPTNTRTARAPRSRDPGSSRGTPTSAPRRRSTRVARRPDPATSWVASSASGVRNRCSCVINVNARRPGTARSGPRPPFPRRPRARSATGADRARRSPGISSPVTASTSEVACTDADRALNSCSSCFSPPRRNESPSTSRRFPRIEPVSDAFTISMRSPEDQKNAMISSVTLPNVALISPPTRGPTCSASCSVERSIWPASGRIAPADVRRSPGWSAGDLQEDRVGTRTRSQSGRLEGTLRPRRRRHGRSRRVSGGLAQAAPPETVLQDVPRQHGALDPDRVLHDPQRATRSPKASSSGSTSPASMPRTSAASPSASSTVFPDTDSVIIDALDWLIEQLVPRNVTSSSFLPRPWRRPSLSPHSGSPAQHHDRLGSALVPRVLVVVEDRSL